MLIIGAGASGAAVAWNLAETKMRILCLEQGDWPIDNATLAPFFDENERMMGVAGLAGDPSGPPRAPQMPPLSLGRTGQRHARAMNELGWRSSICAPAPRAALAPYAGATCRRSARPHS